MASTRALVLLTLVAAALLGQAHAWSAFGHSAVASIANTFLCKRTQARITALLAATNDTSLAQVAPWADVIRRERPETGKLHFIPNQDTPHEGKCAFDVVKDCPDQACVYGAIATNVATIRNATATPVQRSEATKFLVHFVGDLHQPLHATSFLLGGNTLNVTFGVNATTQAAIKTNLHSAWDFSIPNKTVTTLHGGSYDTWISSLVDRIHGEWRAEARGWTKCTERLPRSMAHLCPVEWSRESNALNCAVVFKAADFNATIDAAKQNATAANLVDVSNEYWEATRDTVDKQIARAGVRLAAALETVFTPVRGAPRESVDGGEAAAVDPVGDQI
ncbi:hypothetical protein H9P43_004947 [Blastocladiella emersonii ATCC 22665]|nr:hypothetical protein H9P43_004947 [Blastocladiella emersonii ATCC 22665]